MGTISLQIPVSGQPNSTEDPKIASDFTTVQTVINGNIDTNNVSPTAGITATQLAASAQFGGSVQLTFASPCRVYRNAVYNHGGAGYQTLAFDTVTFDPGSHFSSNVYNCPAAGYYQVNAAVRWQVFGAAFTLGSISIYKNGGGVVEGTVIANAAAHDQSTLGWTVSDIVQCAANDTLNIQVYSNAVQSLTISATNNYMSVVRVA